MKNLVPISRFDRGEASKIFDEVKERGVMIVLKNNVPVGVLIAPEQYKAMAELLEDYALFFEAEKRLKKTKAKELISNEQVLNSLGISESDLDGVEVDTE